MPIDASFFPATFPFDDAGQERTHDAQWIQTGLVALQDPFARECWEYAVENDLYAGQEGFDFQNPYVWLSQDFPMRTADLVPAYGIIGDSYDNVQANVQGHEAMDLNPKGGDWQFPT